MKEAPPRRNSLAAMNALLCVLVVLIHVLSDAITRSDRSSWQFFAVFLPWRLSAFAVQGFIFLSAVKLFMRDEAGGRRFWIGRLRKVILPYALWTVIYYAYFVRHGYYEFSFRQLFESLALGTMSAQFYFIVIIVQFYALLPVSRYLHRRFGAALLIGASLAVTLIAGQYLGRLTGFRYNDRVFTTYLIYWTLGACVGADYDRVRERLCAHRAAVSAIFAAAAVLEVVFAYPTVAGIRAMPGVETVHLCYCVSATAFVFTWAERLFGGGRSLPKCVELTDRVSFAVYLIHVLVIYIVNDAVWRAGITGIAATLALRFIGVYAVSFAAAILWSLAAKLKSGK